MNPKHNEYLNIFREFIASPDSEHTIFIDDVVAQVGKSVRQTEAGQIACLDMTSILRPSRAQNMTVDPNAQSTGFMSRWMDAFEQTAQENCMGVFVEDVINQWLHVWLERRGYTAIIEPCDYDVPIISYIQTFDKEQR